jgi:hypothetical protein
MFRIQHLKILGIVASGAAVAVADVGGDGPGDRTLSRHASSHPEI